MNNSTRNYFARVCCKNDISITICNFFSHIKNDEEYYVEICKPFHENILIRIFYAFLIQYLTGNFKYGLGFAVKCLEDMCIPVNIKCKNPKYEANQEKKEKEFEEGFGKFVSKQKGDFNKTLEFKNLFEMIRYTILMASEILKEYISGKVKKNEIFQKTFNLVTNVVSDFYRMVCKKRIFATVKEIIFVGKDKMELTIFNDNGNKICFFCDSPKNKIKRHYIQNGNNIYVFDKKTSEFLEKLNI